MPTYDYECRKCHHRFEVFHGMSDDRPRRCPRCRSRAVRVPSAGAGLIFKGSGFYITDYRDASYKDKAREEGAAGKETARETGAAGAGGDPPKSGGTQSGESSRSPANSSEGTPPKKAPASGRGTRKKRASGS